MTPRPIDVSRPTVWQLQQYTVLFSFSLVMCGSKKRFDNTHTLCLPTDIHKSCLYLTLIVVRGNGGDIRTGSGGVKVHRTTRHKGPNGE